MIHRQRWFCALSVAIVFIWCLSPVPLAQTQGEIQVTMAEADMTGFPDIDLPVTVLNTNGVPILGIESNTFEVLEDDNPMSITGLTEQTNRDLTIAVTLVLDISGSAPIEEIKAGANQFIDSLDSSGMNNRLALIGFNWQMEVGSFDPAKEVPFTSDLDQVRTVVDGFVAEGGSAVYEAIYKAVLITADEPADRRAVIVMTDGDDTDGTVRPFSRPNIATADTPKDAAKERGIPIFTVGVYQTGFGSNPDYLKVLALETGGRYQEASNLGQLGTLFENVVEQLRTDYYVTVHTAQEPDGKDHVLKLRVNIPQGIGEIERTITYPEPPPVPHILKLQRDVNGELEGLEAGTEVKGQVLLVPQISAQNSIVQIEYYVDGSLASRIDVEGIHKEQHKPWEWTWDTCGVSEDSHTIEIVAYDDAGNASDRFSTQLSATQSPWCVITQNWWLVIIIVAVIVAAVVLLILLSNRNQVKICPVCGNVMDPSWGGVCQFCAAQAAATAPPSTISSPPQGLEAQFAPSTFTPAAQMSNTPVGEYKPTKVMGTSSGYGMGVDTSTSVQQVKTERLKRESPAIAWLIMRRGPRDGQEFRLQEVTAIGRSGQNDIIIDDSKVSRQHAKVRLEGQIFTIFDLGATNPTKVNGQESGRHELIDGDQIEIGNSVLVFKQVKSSRE